MSARRKLSTQPIRITCGLQLAYGIFSNSIVPSSSDVQPTAMAIACIVLGCQGPPWLTIKGKQATPDTEIFVQWPSSFRKCPSPSLLANLTSEMFTGAGVGGFFLITLLGTMCISSNHKTQNFTVVYGPCILCRVNSHSGSLNALACTSDALLSLWGIQRLELNSIKSFYIWSDLWRPTRKCQLS